jgi:hypothetical protein
MRTIRRFLRKTRRGSVLALVLVIGLCLALLGWGMLQMGFGSRLNAVIANSMILARNAADSGLTEAMYKMNKKWNAEKPSWNNSTLPSASNVVLPNSNVKYSYNVTGTFPLGFTITSIGASDRSVKTVHAITKTVSQWVGIGVRLSADIKPTANFGTYPSNTNYDISIRTNSILPNQIVLKNNLTIPGDIVVGPGGDPEAVIDTKAATVIQGDTYSASDLLDFPPNIPPTGWTVSSWTGGTINTGFYQYPSITMNAGDTTEIVGDVNIYVPGNVRIKNSASLKVKAGGSLEIYVGGSFIADNGSLIINEDHDARTFKVYGTPTCTKVEIKNSGDFWGSINAPQADLTIFNSGDAYGGFIGNTLTIKNSGSFYFDTRLAEGLNEPLKFEIIRWWEE